jgi:hypothetical protein
MILHEVCDLLSENPYPPQVDVEDIVPFIEGELKRRCTPGCAGIVDQDVDLGEHLCRLFYQVINILFFGHVAGNRDNPYFEILFQFLCRRLEIFHFSRGNDQIRPGFSQAGGDEFSDSPASAGHESDFAFEIEQLE